MTEKVLALSAIPRSRLGKRSPLGALVCSSSAEGLVDMGGHVDADVAHAAVHHGAHRVKLYPGQRVYLHCGGQECGGMVEQHNHVDNEVSVFIPQLNQRVHRKLEDVWMSPSGNAPHSVSSSIDVPKRTVASVEMDEMMAAMVLTSLSCSPMFQSPIQGEPGPVLSGADCGASEVSDGGYWSCDHGNTSPAPSPPSGDVDKTPPPVDEGLDMDMDQVLFDEPAPRKRRNSVKLTYRCLWPNCGKVLTSIVGMKRHIRILHLGRQNEQERCQREEDFYYTEIYQDMEQSSAPVGSSCPSQQRSSPPTPEPLLPSELSQSAPSSFWQVHSEHSYQAPVPALLTQCKPVCVPVSPRWTAPITVHQNKQAAPFRRRSVSVGEQWLQNNSISTKPHLGSVSPPRNHYCVTRRIRGEAKKCRKVYGIEHRDMWCTACRWKKACQRFLD